MLILMLMMTRLRLPTTGAALIMATHLPRPSCCSYCCYLCHFYRHGETASAPPPPPSPGATRSCRPLWKAQDSRRPPAPCQHTCHGPDGTQRQRNKAVFRASTLCLSCQQSHSQVRLTRLAAWPARRGIPSPSLCGLLGRRRACSRTAGPAGETDVAHSARAINCLPACPPACLLA